MAAMMTIKGFPSSLPEAEIKGLLETIGQVDVFQCSVDGDSLTCRCRYAAADDTAKAKKGFHDLEMGEMTLKVEIDENPAGATADTASAETANTGSAGVAAAAPAAATEADKAAPVEGSGVEEKKPAAEEPPRRKKSRFAPPPTGAVDLQAGLGGAPAPAAAAGLLGIPGLGAGGLGGLPPATVYGAAGAGAGLGALGLPGAVGGLGGLGTIQTPQMKSQVEIFVGNIPVGTTQQGLVDFLNAAMLKVGLNLQPGNPVTSCRLNSKFAFCVMRNPEEAAKALNLNGIPYLGNVLKMQRPSSYSGPPDRAVTWQLRLPEMDGSDDRGGTSDSDSNVSNSNRSHAAISSRKRFGVSRIVPEEGKKRVNYSKGDARRIMEEAVSLCEVMTLGYEVVFHGRRRSNVAPHSRPSIMGEGVRGLSAEPVDNSRAQDADANLPDSEVAYIARSKRDIAEHFGVAWSTMQPRLVGKIGSKPVPTTRVIAMPDAVEIELYQHVVWLCERRHPATWDSIKSLALQLGKITGMNDFAASNQWLKRFKTHFPSLESRYGHHLRTSQTFQVEGGFADGGNDERTKNEFSTSSDETQTDTTATTAGGYLALERARVEAAQGGGGGGGGDWHKKQPPGGMLPDAAGAAAAAADPARAESAAADMRLTTTRMTHAAAMATNREEQLRLPPGQLAQGPVPGGIPPQLLGHPYAAQQLQVGLQPYAYPSQALPDGSLKGGVWGHAGAGMMMRAPATREELQQQQQLGLATHQALPMGVGGQALVGLGGQVQNQQQHQHPLGGGGTPSMPSGFLDPSGLAARQQQPQQQQQQQQQPQHQQQHFAGVQSMVMGTGGPVYRPQVSIGPGVGGMMLYPQGGVAGAGRMVAPNQAPGAQAMGTVGPWQQTPVGWSEQVARPWQTVTMSQPQGLQQQQQVNQVAPPPLGFSPGYSAQLSPDEYQSMLSSVGASFAQQQQQQQQQQHWQQQEQAAAAGAGLTSSLGLGVALGQQQQQQQQQQQLQPAASMALGGGPGMAGGQSTGLESFLNVRRNQADGMDNANHRNLGSREWGGGEATGALQPPTISMTEATRDGRVGGGGGMGRAEGAEGVRELGDQA
eukprot:g8201.t1